MESLVAFTFLWWIVCWIGCSCAGFFLAERRGQSKGFGLVLGLIFGPLGVLIVWCSIDDPRAIEDTLIEKSQAKRCRQCWSIAHPRAKVCPACRAEFE